MKPRVFQSDAQGKEVKSEKKLQGTFWPQKVELAQLPEEERQNAFMRQPKSRKTSTS